MQYNELVKKLYELSDKKYQEFSKSLVNTPLIVIGVRIPKIKELSKELKSEVIKNFVFKEYLETDIFYGLWVNQQKIEESKKFEMLEEVLSKASSWSITDTIICNTKFKDLDLVFSYYKKRTKEKKNEFLCRSGYLLYMKYFAKNKGSLQGLLKNIEESKFYYVNMMIAWCLATIAIYFGDEVFEFLKANNDISTIKKLTIKKINESFRITNEAKCKFLSIK
jgi:3-methyladenine DNA glycosylase AlkD